MPTINFCQAQASALPIYGKSSIEKYNQSNKEDLIFHQWNVAVWMIFPMIRCKNATKDKKCT